MSKPIQTYNGFQIAPNFTSINGTGKRLKSQRGWIVYLPGFGEIGWRPSLREARDSVDFLREMGSPQVMRAIARLDVTA